MIFDVLIKEHPSHLHFGEPSRKKYRANLFEEEKRRRRNFYEIKDRCPWLPKQQVVVALAAIPVYVCAL